MPLNKYVLKVKWFHSKYSLFETGFWQRFRHECIEVMFIFLNECTPFPQFLVQGSLLTDTLMSQGFNCLVYRQFSANFMVVTVKTILFAHTTFLWATCCLICFIPIVNPFLAHWSWLRFIPFIERGNGAHGVCPVNRGCLLLLGTWSHLWYIQRSVYAHSLICIYYKTYEIEYWSLFLSFHIGEWLWYW
jgi:hypothetical protein